MSSPVTPIILVSDPIVDGTAGSASQIQQAFDDLRNQGQISINQLVTLRENTLILFNNALSELNGKRVRANRLPEIGIAAKFITTDLQDINQTITTATVRADANSFSLRERMAPGAAIVSQVRFSASEGTIQALQVPQTGASGNLGALYRVATPDGSIPTGTFSIQLLTPISPALLIFDMIDMPSGPTVEASISQNGITYTDALSITQNGYRWGAYFQPQEIQYINLTITPALPDTLGGSVFTFGLTDFHAFAVQYHLLSDVYTNQIEITPRSAQVQFITDTVPGLTYFLSLEGLPAIEVFPGTIVPLPGTSTITETNKALIPPTGSPWASATPYALDASILDSNGNLETATAILGTGTSGGSAPTWSITGRSVIDNPGADQITWTETAWAELNYTLPADIYLSTLVVTDHATGLEIRTAPGLPKTSIGLTNQYFAVDGNHLYLVIYNHAVDQSRTFDVSFIAGPATITASLQTELETSDLNTTPIYSGAELLEV